MTANRHLAKQGRTPPPAGHHHCSGGSLLYVVTCLGLPLCHDIDLYLLIGLGPPLFWMRWSRRCWPLSCRSSSLPRSGSWIAEKVSSWHGKMVWWLPSALYEGCSWNVMMSATEPRLSSRSIWLGCVLLQPVANIPLTSARFWREAGSFFPYRRQT
jgi:hypothetical protein